MGIITNFYNMTSPIGLFGGICSAAQECNKKNLWKFVIFFEHDILSTSQVQKVAYTFMLCTKVYHRIF